MIYYYIRKFNHIYSRGCKTEKVNPIKIRVDDLKILKSYLFECIIEKKHRLRSGEMLFYLHIRNFHRFLLELKIQELGFNMKLLTFEKNIINWYFTCASLFCSSLNWIIQESSSSISNIQYHVRYLYLGSINKINKVEIELPIQSKFIDNQIRLWIQLDKGSVFLVFYILEIRTVRWYFDDCCEVWCWTIADF